MKIGIDARLALRKRRGIGRVLLNLINHLSMIDRKNQYILYLEKEDTDCILPTADNITKRVLPPQIYPLWEQISLPIACKIDKVDVLHCPANTGPVVVPRSVKLIVTLHDVMFLKPYSEIPLSSNTYQNLGRVYRRLCTKLLRKRADYFITDSEWSRQDIQQLLGIPRNRIAVIPCGVDDYFLQGTERDCKAILNQLGIDFKFIFHLGGISPNKNTIGAIKAYSMLIKVPQYRDLHLVVGGISPRTNNQITWLVKQNRWEKLIKFLGYITDEELKCLYKGAELFLFPSLYEGFGLPALEAMACGTPVVASNRSSIPEVVGEAGLLVDPTDLKAISNAMKIILQDEDLRVKLKNEGRARAMEFNWETAAKEVIQVYRKAQMKRYA